MSKIPSLSSSKSQSLPIPSLSVSTNNELKGSHVLNLPIPIAVIPASIVPLKVLSSIFPDAPVLPDKLTHCEPNQPTKRKSEAEAKAVISGILTVIVTPLPVPLISCQSHCPTELTLSIPAPTDIIPCVPALGMVGSKLPLGSPTIQAVANSELFAIVPLVVKVRKSVPEPTGKVNP
ncbi:hypothetical protein L3X37_14875 [Sabulilitoribacter arenilitoris]|uniref:Uncharacterized protein n=1 Tax=Wocania arenilitoris TaxID=2044858 RepID=A0AAE3ESR9_9FLAO|nr:hypothetical protein [Wocania arenilitoris]MCF7569629.1 hypothetical protein [Wocania arenilitoris]